MKVFLSLISALTIHSSHATSSTDYYSQIFPLYLEYCAATKIVPTVGEAGGFGGHAVLYVQGLCKNENVDYPKVESCSRIPQQKHPHTGVGISVDKYFKNVNWVAVPGYDFFIRGGLNQSSQVNSKALETLIAQTVDRGVFKGVLYDEAQVGRELLVGDQKNGSHFYEEAISNLAAGTDMAIQWGRSLECIRMPITEPQLYAVRDYLNRLNEKYYQHPDKPFEWSAYYNNCTHTSSNAFATVGARGHIETDSNFAWQALNLANPANPLITLQYITQRQTIELSDVLTGGKFDKTFKKYEWLPAGAGTLTVHHPIFKDNLLFQTEDLSASVFPPKPLHRSYAIWSFHQNEAQSHANTDLEANLNQWLNRYQTAVKSTHTLSSSWGQIEQSEKENLLRNYYLNSVKSVKNKLEKLKALKATQ